MGGARRQLGELRFCSAAPEVGAEWTDNGSCREQRHLKSRPAGEWRRVPIPPPLTRLLRAHLETFGSRPGGRVFSGVHGAELASITYRRVWDKARHAALTPPADCILPPKFPRNDLHLALTGQASGVRAYVRAFPRLLSDSHAAGS